MDKKDVLEYRRSGENTWEITDIAVHSKRRAGVGTKMVNEMIEAIKKDGATRIYAITRASNLNAQKFYESMGMRSIELYDFYDSENGVMYLKRI